ncbi:MAG: hypothetical protein IKM34_08085, partial [Clostridia bacterium]|nr:hypothetical protein [Clostridia bacterium]
GEGSGEGSGELPVPGKPEIIRVYLYQLQKYYDGTPLYFEQDDYEIIELPDGVELVLNLNISLTDVGSLSLSDINENLSDYVTYRVYRDGKDVTAEHVLFFDTFDSSSEAYLPIRVDKRPIVVTSASQTKVDDGTPLENHDVFISKGSLAEGHRLEVNVIGFIDIAGSVENEIASAVILDEYGMDVSSNYEIECIHGTLTILPSDE